MRYGLVGLGHRADMYVAALLGEWRDAGTIAAFCDVNRARMAYYNARLDRPVPCHPPHELGELLDEVDAVIVTSVDVTHARYVCAALDAGRDVIVEKPLTIDAEGCAAVKAAAERSAADLTVTFNYRYSPRNTEVRRLLAEGAIGRVTAVHFEWSLDTIHGADYFRRWHRDRANSGGLLVHKATHHFDLVNWWLAAAPRTVFAQTDLRFYGSRNAPGPRPARGRGAPGLGSDPFLVDLAADPRLKRLYLDAEHEDGYVRDRDVFGEGITIDDTMAVLVRYDNRTLLTYSLSAYAPYEGYRVAFTGTEGRLELAVVERAWSPPHAAIDPTASARGEAAERLTLQRHWKEPEEVPIERGAGAHGGADRLLLDDVFRRPGDDPLGRRAGYLDGIRSVLVGVAANQSTRTGLPVHLTDDGTATASR